MIEWHVPPQHKTMGYCSLESSTADAREELGSQNILGYVDQQYSGLCRPPIKHPQSTKIPLEQHGRAIPEESSSIYQAEETKISP